MTDDARLVVQQLELTEKLLVLLPQLVKLMNQAEEALRNDYADRRYRGIEGDRIHQEYREDLRTRAREEAREARQTRARITQLLAWQRRR